MATIPDTSAGMSTVVAGTSAPASSVVPGLVERAKSILLTPKTEWAVIVPEPTTPAQLYTGYVVPLAALAAVIAIIHMSVIGVSMPFSGTFRLPLTSGLTTAVLTFVFGLVGLFLVGLIINALAPSFGGTRDQRQALKTAAYAFTPAWVGSVFSLLPALSTVLQLVAGIYGIYLLYLGLPLLMKSPRERAFGYTATVVLCTILVGISFGIVSAAVTGVTHMNPYGSFGGSSAQSEAAAQQQGAAMVGNALGSALGTDAQGKAGLGNALAHMAQAGRQMEQQTAGAANATVANAGATSAGAGEPAQANMPAAASASGQANAAAAGSASPADAASAAAGFVGALGGALGGSHRVEPVDFRNLKSMLPASLPGMARTGAEGSNQQAAGVKTSSATADYKGAGNQRVHVKIADVSGVSGLLDMAGSLGAQTTDSESDLGFERDKAVGGRRFHEKFTNANQHGELDIMVAQRFEVNVTGDGVDMSTLEQTAGQVDLARLESMKNQGATAN